MQIYCKMLRFLTYMYYNIKIFFFRKKTYIWSVARIFCVSMLLATCTSSNIIQNSHGCTINHTDHLKYYLNDFNKNLFELKIPKELDITLPDIDIRYYIPPINSANNYNHNEDEVNINIYPSIIFRDILSESCLINS